MGYCPSFGAQVSEISCHGNSDDSTNDDNSVASDVECIQINGWSTTGYGGGFDMGTWTVYAAQPELNGYTVYKWSEGNYYMYTLGHYYWYTISAELDSWSGLKGWCGNEDYSPGNTPILECDGVWGTGVRFYDCGSEPLILSACLDDAAESVRFLLDADDEGNYMQFDLHTEVGCWADSDEPVWKHTADDATLYYLHRDANLGAWMITMHLIEGDSVYECFEDTIEDCTAGTWIEFYSPEPDFEGKTRAVRTLDTASVEVSMGGAEKDKDMTVVDDLAIVLVVLLFVAVVGIVALLWCRRRNRAKGGVTFKNEDEHEITTPMTATVGDTVDVGTDEEDGN